MAIKAWKRLLVVLTIIVIMAIVIVSLHIRLEPGTVFSQAVYSTSSILTNALRVKYEVDWKYSTHDDPWRVASSWLSGRHVHPEYTPELGTVLRAMTTKKILSADLFHEGIQLKLMLQLEGGQKAVFRPKRYERNFTVEKFYSGDDMHNGEIAAYHLGRILEFRRAPHVIGRYVNVKTEILPVASERLKEIIREKDGTICLSQYCETCPIIKHKTSCAYNNVLEGSIALWLSSPMNMIENPWRHDNEHTWHNDAYFCYETFLSKPEYSRGPLFLDLIDMAIFDFLIGNPDRHSLMRLDKDDTSMFVMIDNANSFGNPYHNLEFLFILAPVSRCCRIRNNTWIRMLSMKGILGDVLKAVINQDPIAPVLTQGNIDSVNRRLETAIYTVQECINGLGEEIVLVGDSL